MNLSEEIQKLLKVLISGEILPEVPEQILQPSGKKAAAKPRPVSPTKDENGEIQ